MLTRENSEKLGSWPVFGHDWAVHLLQQSLALQQRGTKANVGGPSHAYLLLGAAQIGKTTLATVFAQTLFCSTLSASDNLPPRPCGSCRACRLMQAEAHPDFRLVQPLDKNGEVDRTNGTLRAEQVADIIRETVLSPLEGQYKIFVIQDAHTANDSFANKLLKTLEEPPEHVILCLTAADRARLLPTIVSRCQILELRPLATSTIEEALITKWQVEPQEAHLLARLAAGRLGWAVQRVQDSQGLQWREEALQTLSDLLSANRAKRLEFAEKLSAKRDDQQLFTLLELWSSWWRDVLLAQAGCVDACINIDKLVEIRQQADNVPTQIVQNYLHTLQRIEQYLHHTVNLRLALDVLLLRLLSSTT